MAKVKQAKQVQSKRYEVSCERVTTAKALAEARAGARRGDTAYAKQVFDKAVERAVAIRSLTLSRVAKESEVPKLFAISDAHERLAVDMALLVWKVKEVK